MFLFYLQLFIFILHSLFFFFYLTEALMNCYYTCKIQQLREDSLHFLQAVKHQTIILQILGLTCSFWDLLPKSRVTSHTLEPAPCPQRASTLPQGVGKHSPCPEPLLSRCPGLPVVENTSTSCTSIPSGPNQLV